MNKLVNKELQSMKFLLGYQRGKVISEQANDSAVTPQDLIKQIQSVLKTKYNANLGTTGPNKDGIDGKWGNLTQTAFENAVGGASAKTENLIKQIQTVLKTRYNADIGTTGPNRDGIDGKWGNLTQTAFENAIKRIPSLKKGQPEPVQSRFTTPAKPAEVPQPPSTLQQVS